MTEQLLGVVLPSQSAPEAIAAAERAEQLGIGCAWMTQGSAAIDALTTLAAASMRTRRIKFATSVVPTYTRHPMVIAGQARVIAHLAPGRLRLGVGPSHPAHMEPLGVKFEAPLSHLREYVTIVRTLLQTGQVDFQGQYYRAKTSLPQPLAVPVFISALQRRSFELAGEIADGAISQICPSAHLEKVALPLMAASAKKAARPTPALLAHAPLCVHEDRAEVYAAVRAGLGLPRLPAYQKMLIDAGYPEAAQGTWSDRMIDAIVSWGSEADVAERLRGLWKMGATEVIASPLPVGSNPQASLDRTWKLLGQLKP